MTGLDVDRMYCARCGTRPVKIKNRRLCRACYSRLRRENRIDQYPAVSSELVTADRLDHGWIWNAEPACAGSNPELFFDPDLYREALTVCARCPVSAECLALADAGETVSSEGHVYGVFGGQTPAERIERRKAEPPR